MATVRASITRAMRKLRLIGAGAVPTSEEAADGLAVVQGIYDGWASGGMFGRLGGQLSGQDNREAYIVLTWGTPDGETDLEAPIRVRNLETGAEEPPADLSFFEVVDETAGTRRAFVWDARKGGWVRFDSLTLDSEAPLSLRNEEGFAALVALHMAEEFGAQIGPMTAREAGSFRLGLSAKYGEARTTGQADFF